MLLARFLGGGIIGAAIAVWMCDYHNSHVNVLVGGTQISSTGYGFFAIVGFVLGGVTVLLVSAADIRRRAAASSASEESASSEPGAQASTDVPEQIRKLGRLRDEGLLTEDEFDAKKAELLRRM
jgi:hypothetical protein